MTAVGRALLVLAAGAALAVAGCAPPPLLSRSGWTGQGDVLAMLRADAEALQAVEDLTVEMTFTLPREGSARGSLIFRPPALMRLDVRGPLFQHLLTAVLDGDRLTAVAQGRVYLLSAADGLDTFLGIDLAGYDPRLALLGVVAPPAAGHDSVRYPRADRAEITTDEGGGRRRRLWVDLHRGFVEREDLLDAEGRLLWSRGLHGWRRLPGTDLYLPRQVRLQAGERTLGLALGHVRVDTGLERTAFYSGVPGS